MNKEYPAKRIVHGPTMLVVNLAVLVLAVALFITCVVLANENGTPKLEVDRLLQRGNIVKDSESGAPNLYLLLTSVLLFVGAIFSLKGHFTLQPNQARVLTLFGAYRGTERQSGLHWTNPLYGKRRISLRAQNLNGEKLKVNDKRGNPVEIAAVVVWRVQDTFQAVFDVENYDAYVHIQSESAVRHVASSYAYDHGEEHELTLRSSTEEVCAALQRELQERGAKAGVAIDEARLTHLAYAPEIAGVMLRRQQAEAIIDARQKIVHGAVSMVKMALQDLAEQGVVQLDEERKASMVSNLLVVLCGEKDAQPVVNAGTLYS
jgi:regulator of protease activity HflC (stomatin/prohibitin superfamily)